ncbi:alpha/beta hydrolase [Candidatus Parcubacteria bacterium]|nr:alpha/beta hydrolase [Candidatus Parcubacteria bacterium]
MIEKSVSIKNLNVNYKVFGEDLKEKTYKPMLILHGWPSSSDKWITVGELLERQNIKAIVVDLPGFGKSQEPSEAWNTDIYIEWVREFCDNVEDLKRDFYLAGHSFGGSLAAKFAVKYNQRLKGLFLISAACVRESTAGKKFYYRIAKMVKIFSFLPYYDLFRRAIYKFVIRKSDYPHVKGIMRETYLKVVSEDLSFRLVFIKIPTVIIWGDKDTSTPLSDAEFIKSKISDSKLIVLPGLKHSLQIEAPELLAQKIIENIA